MTARDRFDLHESVGRDALGEVFRATERSSGKKAAVKVFDPLALRSRDGREAYLGALKVLRDILPARTPPVSGFALRSDDGWVASRWVEGRTLADVLAADGPMDFDDAAAVTTGILDALDELHSSGQAHGGLSPNKVLLFDGCNAGGVVLTDPFQHHLYSVADPIKTSRADPERFFGLPEYFSPEQAQGKAPDERSDVYVVGLLLYEMLTGKSTFGAKSVSTTLKRQIYERPLAPRHARPGLVAPDDAEIIINMALNKSSDDRFQSALAFRRALNNLRDGDETTERAAEPMGISPVGVLVGKPVPTGELEALPSKPDDVPDTPSEAQTNTDDVPDTQSDAQSPTDDAADDRSTIAFSPADLAKRMAEGIGDVDIPQSAQDHATGQPRNVELADSDTSEADATEDHAPKTRSSGDTDVPSADGRDDNDDEAPGSASLALVDDRATMAFSPSQLAKKANDTEATDESESGGGSKSTKKGRGKKNRKDRGQSSSRSDSGAGSASARSETGKSDPKKPDAKKSDSATPVSSERSKSSDALPAKQLSDEERAREAKAKSAGPIDVAADDELNWFAIGDDVGALTERHEAIVDVSDRDENAAQNKRFVFGAIIAIVLGIVGVMVLSALGGSDAPSVPPSETDEPAAVDSALGAAQSAVDQTAPSAAEAANAAAAAEQAVDEGSAVDHGSAAAAPDEADWLALDPAEDGNADGVDAAAENDELLPTEEPVAEDEPVAEAAAQNRDREDEGAAPAAVEREARRDDEIAARQTDDEEAAREAARTRAAEEEAARDAEREATREAARELADQGQAALRSGNWSEAQRLLEESLQRYDGSASAQAGLGRAHFEQRNFSQAARYFRAATRINSSNADYHESLGQAYFRLGNLEAALSAFEEAERRGHPNGARNVALVRDRIAASAE